MDKDVFMEELCEVSPILKCMSFLCNVSKCMTMLFVNVQSVQNECQLILVAKCYEYSVLLALS